MDSISAQVAADADPVFGRLNRLQAILRSEDDRGMILLASAYLDDLLSRLISSFLIDVKATRSLLAGYNAPIGTFHSRIQMAFALGLVSDVQYKDLQTLRRVRNDIAHTWEKVSVETPNIADKIRLMSITRIPDDINAMPNTLSDRLRQCVSCMMIELEVMLEQLRKGASGRRRLRSIALHLSVNPPD